jgi:hypothetical protein
VEISDNAVVDIEPGYESAALNGRDLSKAGTGNQAKDAIATLVSADSTCRFPVGTRFVKVSTTVLFVFTSHSGS